MEKLDSLSRPRTTTSSTSGTSTRSRRRGRNTLSSWSPDRNGRSGPRERSLSRKGQDSSVDELGLVALIGREERVNLGGGLEGVGLSVGLGLAAGTGTGTAPGRGLGRSL